MPAEKRAEGATGMTEEKENVNKAEVHPTKEQQRNARAARIEFYRRLRR